MKSSIIKRSVVVMGTRRASAADDFWKGLKEIASARNTPLSELVEIINAYRRAPTSSAIRLFVLGFYRDQIADARAGRKGVAAGPSQASCQAGGLCRRA